MPLEQFLNKNPDRIKSIRFLFSPKKFNLNFYKNYNLIVDEVLLGIYTDLDELKDAVNGYILRNGEELYITTKKINEKPTNRDIDNVIGIDVNQCLKQGFI